MSDACLSCCPVVDRLGTKIQEHEHQLGVLIRELADLRALQQAEEDGRRAAAAFVRGDPVADAQQPTITGMLPAMRANASGRAWSRLSCLTAVKLRRQSNFT